MYTQAIVISPLEFYILLAEEWMVKRASNLLQRQGHHCVNSIQMLFSEISGVWTGITKDKSYVSWPKTFVMFAFGLV